MARGDGKGRLGDLGIQVTEAVADAKVSKGVLYDGDLSARGDGAVVRGLVGDVLDLLLEEQLRLREATVESYAAKATSIADGAGRETIASALLEQLRLYGAVPADSDDLTRARERVYYLAIALCDAATSRNDKGISDSEKPLPDLRFRRHLLEVHGRHREALVEVFREFLLVAKREPIHSVEQVERVLATFIEGAQVFRRIAGCHEEVGLSPGTPAAEDLVLDDEDLVDVVLRIFMAMSSPVGGEAPDPEAVLFRRDNDRLPPRSAPEATLHLEAKGIYGNLVDLIDGLEKSDELLLCSLHSSGAARARTPDTEAVAAAVQRFAERGGQLRNMEKIGSVEELEATVARLEEQIADGQEVRYRALLLDAPPCHSPLMVGDRASFLIRSQEDGLVVDAMAFVDEAGRAWCRSHYDDLWADERGFTLATPNGLNRHRIAEARMRLEGLERQQRAITET
ncbi:MAG TPA: hypothetical protein VFX85_10280 [Solirubrobacterales bacterium]|nr:hypothetical protein [Solirubrobacterales bacterium]